MENAERMLPGGIKTLLAPPAQFVKTNRREGTNQGEAGHEREEKRQKRVSGDESGEEDADNRIDEAEKHDMTRLLPEIVKTPGQGIFEVRHCDFADTER